MNKAWRSFNNGEWQNSINVRNFIQTNVNPYHGDETFLCGSSERTKRVWQRCRELLWQEVEHGGVLGIDTDTISSITAHDAGYIDKENEVIVGLQTKQALERSVIPSGGIRMVEQACAEYGAALNPRIQEIYHHYRKTHNDAVFSAYTPEMKLARKVGVITGLPDAYGRGRIIGDYRRVALYGGDYLIEQKKHDLAALDRVAMNEQTIRLREEISEQLQSLQELKQMAEKYGLDISGPAQNATEAVQWTYFAYLGAIKEQNGAAMSLGRVSTFLDIYIERDLGEGTLDEMTAQELIDQFIIKLRMARHLRTPDYNELFAGDPLWITEVLGGMGEDGRTLVTKTSFRFLHTLTNLGPAPEPNITVLWSEQLPTSFKEYCAKVSIETSSIQYENDDLMRPDYGDDYGIACCVSAMKIGKQMQFFGARTNLAKALLLALNGGRDEQTGEQVAPVMPVIEGDVLDYQQVKQNYDKVLDWLAGLYVNTMNIIHYMHDKYCYERLQLALHDSQVERLMAFGIAGLSVAADSLSAIQHTTVRVVRNQQGLTERFEIEGNYPQYGNDDDRVDQIAVDLTKGFERRLKTHPAYRDAKHTLSVLTITSNVVYGKKTGATPDGRMKGEPFAPGANPMHGRDQHGALAAMNSVAKLPYSACKDGISYTFSIVPATLGKGMQERCKNLAGLLDGYFHQQGHHININVLDRETLLDAMENPQNYPQLTIRVSGYAVHFIKLTRAQQQEVISRTFYQCI